MDVFELRDKVVSDYSDYARSFLTIRDPHIARHVDERLAAGMLWPEPLIQISPAFEPGEPISELVAQGLLHPECERIFRRKPDPLTNQGPLRFHRHQVEAFRAADAGDHYVLTTGTGSGKSLSYIVPIVDHVLRRGSGRGIQAIVVYPMNALANSQKGELEKFLCHGYPAGPPVTFRRYTGQEREAEKHEIIQNPPDILLTNYVMLELVLTRPWERKLVQAARDLRFFVLDELHTYRGRQGADVGLLVRRVREACGANKTILVGTSATLAGQGTWPEQQREVARLATQVFGSEVKPDRVIGETLRRVTPDAEGRDEAFLDQLRARVQGGTLPHDGAAFIRDALSRWIESTLGVRREAGSGRLVRCTPRPLRVIASELAQLTGLERDACQQALRSALLAGYRHRDDHGRPAFAFRLHQFVSKGESVYASLAVEAERHLTLQAQEYVPGSHRAAVLLPLVFCRECGQEYYVVRRGRSPGGALRYVRRELSDRVRQDDGGEAGFLYLRTDEDAWPSERHAVLERLPDSWLELGDSGPPLLREARRDDLPLEVHVSPLGEEVGSGQGLRAHYLRAPFRFCLHCRVAYDARQSSDFGKLATLGSEGRSTATSVLSLATVQQLRADAELEPVARKLLSFTDNRQDASLQAGHFNDFVEVGLLRSGLWRAVTEAGLEGLRHDHLTQAVFKALRLPLSAYADNPQVKYAAREDTDRALRQVLGYYLYRDLRRGWRVTSPNLEQCGLLEIDYLSLPEVCADQTLWERDPRSGELRHPALVSATPKEREDVCRVLLDFLRRELALRVGYLDPTELEAIRQLALQRLRPPWRLDDQDPRAMEASRIVLPRSRGGDRRDRFVYLSARGGFGLFLKRSTTFAGFRERLKTEDSQTIISALLEVLREAGLVDRVLEPRREADPTDETQVPGYQINASSLIWRAGDGGRAFHDPVRVPNAPAEGLRTNPYFVEFYRSDPAQLQAIEAREHTAQVSADERERREDRFREGALPILFCSPTMELGVDIAELNAVNLRNVPPTPANYAQRSGRAGRSGQPAFILTYCATGSPHDQYFFARPQQMVDGAVKTPLIDLGNEDLLRAHVQAVWLSEARLSLGESLSEILDVDGDAPNLALRPHIRETLDDPQIKVRAKTRAVAALAGPCRDLVEPGVTVEAWIDDILGELADSFQRACDRWRDLYRSAHEQAKRQARILRDASRDKRERDGAKRLHDEAVAQLKLLLEAGNERFSDFNSYRYFASEGFLPGYNFPRLPLSAYLPGQRARKETEDFLSRPRFLAISEFGPHAIVYHEGARYVINKVILPVGSEQGSITRRASQCASCGYLHPLGDDPGPDLCERCGARLPAPFDNLFRLQNVSTHRKDRINSDEEERLRFGYELRTGVRFAERGGVSSVREASLLGADGAPIARLVYGHAATLWRMNVGLRRRRNEAELGFGLNVERGTWSRDENSPDDPEDPSSPRVQRVIPYVEDRRNCLLVEPLGSPDLDTMASLQAALKRAIQATYQIEDNELAAEPLPSADDRRSILLYEAAEGGAGVLRGLVQDPYALPAVAHEALRLCHFDAETGQDRRRGETAAEDCEKACYDCLLSYYNQRDHRRLDRHLVSDLLLAWTTGQVQVHPRRASRRTALTRLLDDARSDAQTRWLQYLEQHRLHLPDESGPTIEQAEARADFAYRRGGAAVLVVLEGPGGAAATLSPQVQEQLEDAGYAVVRFAEDPASWAAVIARYPSLFGEPLRDTGEHPSVGGRA